MDCSSQKADVLLDGGEINHMPCDVTEVNVEAERDALGQRLVAFVHVAERNRARMLWLAQRTVSCREEAEDIVQEALLKALTGLPRFRGESQMETWLNSIVRNTVCDHLRKRGWRVEMSLDHFWTEGDEVVVFDVPDLRRNPEESYELEEMETILIAALEKLTSQSRRVFELCVIEELPYQAVAKELNVKVATVKSKAFNTRRALMRTIRTWCAELHDQ